MTASKRRVGILVIVVLSVLLVAGCTRDAASDPLANATTAPKTGAQSTDTTATPSEFPTALPAATVPINPTAVPTTAPAPASGAAPTLAPVVVAAPTVTPTVTPTPVPGAGTTYTVKAGDRLFSIGRQFGVNPYSIAQLNGIVPPYIIHPGDTLKIPGSGTPGTPPPVGGKTHIVAPGENLFRIALRYGTTVQALAAANKISNVNLIFIGRVLTIP